jgi:tetratricopeptide (TPR) repeat protein
LPQAGLPEWASQSEDAISMDPGFTSERERIARLIRQAKWRMRTGDWREAAALLGQLARLRGSDRDWTGLGVAREQLGEHWSARQAYRRALEANRQNRTAQLGLERLTVPDEGVTPRAPREYVRTVGYPGYITGCWNCAEEIDSTAAIRCERCGLFVCPACGECRCRAPLGDGMIEAPDPGLEDDYWE